MLKNVYNHTRITEVVLFVGFVIKYVSAFVACGELNDLDSSNCVNLLVGLLCDT